MSVSAGPQPGHWVLRARAWVRAAQLRIDEVGVRLYSAAIAYRTIFSLVAFASTVVLIAYLAGMNANDARVAGGDVAGVSEDLEKIARERVARTLELGTSSVVMAGLIGVLLGLYGMSGGFAAICDVLDRVHGTQRYVRLTLRYLRGAGVAAVFIVLAGVAIVFAALSTSTGEYFLGLVGLDVAVGAWSFLVLVVVPCTAILVAFGFVLRYGSHARPDWGQVLVGAVVASAACVLLVLGFAAAVRLFHPWEAYGVFATAVTLLLFGYVQSYVLILTAMFGAELVELASLAPLTRRLVPRSETTDD